MLIEIIPACRREVERFPQAIREDLADALARLEQGHMLSMPLSRPMPSLGKGVHELRLKDPSGIYRVVYVIVRHRSIYVIHAFKKTTQTIPKKNMKLIKKRLKEI